MTIKRPTPYVELGTLMPGDSFETRSGARWYILKAPPGYLPALRKNHRTLCLRYDITRFCLYRVTNSVGALPNATCAYKVRRARSTRTT